MFSWIRNKFTPKSQSSSPSTPTPTNSKPSKKRSNNFDFTSVVSQPYTKPTTTVRTSHGQKRVNKPVSHKPVSQINYVGGSGGHYVSLSNKKVMEESKKPQSKPIKDTVVLNPIKNERVVRNKYGQVSGYTKSTPSGMMSIPIMRNEQSNQNNTYDPNRAGLRTHSVTPSGKVELIKKHPKSFGYVNIITNENPKVGLTTGVLAPTTKNKEEATSTTTLLPGGGQRTVTTVRVSNKPSFSYRTMNETKRREFKNNLAYEQSQSTRKGRVLTNINVWNPVNPHNPLGDVGGEATLVAMDLSPLGNLKNSKKHPFANFRDVGTRLKHLTSKSWYEQKVGSAKKETIKDALNANLNTPGKIISYVEPSPGVKFAEGYVLGGPLGKIFTGLGLSAAEGNVLAGKVLTGLKVAGAGAGAYAVGKSVIKPYVSGKEEEAGKNAFNLGLFTVGMTEGFKAGSNMVLKNYKPNPKNVRIIKEKGVVNEHELVKENKGEVVSYQKNKFRVVNRAGGVLDTGKVGVKGDYAYSIKNNNEIVGAGKEKVLVKTGQGIINKGEYDVGYNLKKLGDYTVNEDFVRGEGWSLKEPINREVWTSKFGRVGGVGDVRSVSVGEGTSEYEDVTKSQGIIKSKGVVNTISNKGGKILDFVRTKFGSKGLKTTKLLSEGVSSFFSGSSSSSGAGLSFEEPKVSEAEPMRGWSLGGIKFVSAEPVSSGWSLSPPTPPAPTNNNYDVINKVMSGSGRVKQLIKPPSQILKSVKPKIKVSKSLISGSVNKDFVIEQSLNGVVRDVVVTKTAGDVKNSFVIVKNQKIKKSLSPLSVKSKIVKHGLLKNSKQTDFIVKKDLVSKKKMSVVQSRVTRRRLISKRSLLNKQDLLNKKSLLNKQGLRSVSLTKQIPKQKVVRKHGSLLEQSSAQAQAITPKQNIMLKQKNVLKQSKINEQTMTLNNPFGYERTFTQITPPPNAPIIPPIFGRGRGKGLFSGRGPKQYTPTITAETMNIFGKRPKRITGFGIRPLQRKKRKKSKRKKSKKKRR
ncbi:MAG: hypothetical protein GWP10_22215 [Nitrospiraceae bacterium]|nr:hypothetical protein [Nitrospiraceae bacterium]